MVFLDPVLVTFGYLTYLISNYAPYAMVALMLPYFYFKRPKEMKLLLIALFANIFLVTFLKNFFNIPRPFDKGIDPSFPSAHASLSFGLARFLKFNEMLYYLGLLLALFVSFGRVYTGYHTVVDVVAGGVLGYAISEATMRFWPRFFKKKKLHRK